MSNFLLRSLSSINGVIELPYDVEFTSESTMLTFYVDKRKSFTNDCRIFVSTVALILLSVRTSKFLKENIELKSYIIRPNKKHEK